MGQKTILWLNINIVENYKGNRAKKLALLNISEISSIFRKSFLLFPWKLHVQDIPEIYFLCIRVTMFREKKIFREAHKRRKFWLIPLEFRLFSGTDARNSFPSHSAEGKNVENSVQNHFIKEENTQKFVILFWTIPRKIKMLEIFSEQSRRR